MDQKDKSSKSTNPLKVVSITSKVYDFEEICGRLACGTEVMEWPKWLSMAESHLTSYGYDSLSELVLLREEDGGLGYTRAQVRSLLTFNPKYSEEGKRLLAKMEIAEIAKETNALVHRGQTRDESKPAPKQQGTSAAYRIGLLKRDFPEIAQRLEQGEFSNVADAERAAGIRPPKRKRVMVPLYEDDWLGSLERIVAEHFPNKIIKTKI